jgi:TetR/AcrR family acrAB operon transcriptional repressor
MPRNSREEAEQTRLRIIDAAMTVFGRRGFASASLEEIAGEVGMTRGAIYGHFRGKVDLYEQLMRFSQEPLYELTREAIEDTESPAIDALRRFMLRWLILLEENPRHRDSFEILLNKTELTEELSRLLDTERRLTRDVIDGLAVVVERAIASGELPASSDPWRCGLAIYAYLQGLTQTWLFNPRLFRIKVHAEALVDQFLVGLAAAATPQNA